MRHSKEYWDSFDAAASIFVILPLLAMVIAFASSIMGW